MIVPHFVHTMRCPNEGTRLDEVLPATTALRTRKAGAQRPRGQNPERIRPFAMLVATRRSTPQAWTTHHAALAAAGNERRRWEAGGETSVVVFERPRAALTNASS